MFTEKSRKEYRNPQKKTQKVQMKKYKTEKLLAQVTTESFVQPQLINV